MNNFIKLKEPEQLDYILNVLKNDKKHNFAPDKKYNLQNISEATLKAIILYYYYNETNPLGLVGENHIKICFQPHNYNAENIDSIITYFAHIVTQDNGTKRVYSKTKYDSLGYLMLVIQAPESIYEQTTTKHKSFLFERNLPSSKQKETCCVVLYVEKISENLLRVVTMLPDQKLSQLENKKEANKIIKLASFSELYDAISLSVAGEEGNKSDLFTNFIDTNVNKINNNTNNNPEVFKGGGQIQNTMSKVSELKEKLAKINKGIASPATPEAQRKVMEKVKVKLESDIAEEESKPAPKPEPKKAVKKAVPVAKKVAKEKKNDETITTINGKEFNLADCKEALMAWEERKKQAKEAGNEYKTKPVTQKVSENIATAVNKAAEGVSKSRMENNPNDVAKGAEMIKKAVDQMFAGFEKMTGKKIGEAKRKEIMAILNDIKEEANENK